MFGPIFKTLVITVELYLKRLVEHIFDHALLVLDMHTLAGVLELCNGNACFILKIPLVYMVE